MEEDIDIPLLKDRIKFARKKAKFTQNNLANLCGLKRSSVTQWENGQTKDLKSSNLVVAAYALGVTEHWLGKNIPPMQKSTHKDYLDNSLPAPQVLYSVTPPSEGDEFYNIEYYDAKGSCGGGTINRDDFCKGNLKREIGWFNHFNVKPKNCKAIYADGDSMADFIVDGDMVIFDISKTEPISGKIFLLRYSEGLRIKELYQQVSGKWKIKSRNPAWEDEELADSDEIEIVGQFVSRGS